MRFLTDFADLAVVLPVAMCWIVGLGATGWWRGAAAFGVAVGATMGVVLALKLVCLGCPIPPGRAAFSASGHVAGGTLVYGGAAALWLRRRLGVWPAAGFAAVPVAVVIAVTRVALHLHSVSEAAVGGIVGIGGVIAMLVLAGSWPDRARMGPAVLVVIPILVLLHGVRLPAEARIKDWGGWMPAGICATVGVAR
jgi:hypothetical protein